MIKISEVLTEFRIPAGEQKVVYQFKGFTASQMDELHAMLHRAGIVTTPDFNKRTITTYSNRDAMKLKKNKSIQRFIKSKGGKQIKESKYEVYFDMGSAGLMSKTVDAKNAKEAEKKVASGLKKGTYKIKKVVKEGTCGYGLNGKLGEEPAGPNLRKKIKDISKDKNESVGSKKYDGRDWFWPHDFRHYLRDASPVQRKKIHDAWLKIGVPVKKTGLKISDRYLEPKKNQLKKAWTIVRKVVAPKELGMPIPESVNEAMSESKRFKIYNSLKKGDIVSIKYDSSIQKGTKYIPYVVTKGKTKLMKGKIERIILKNPSNPRFKAYLYNRDGDVSLALGDMAASIVDMKKGKVKESVNEGGMELKKLEDAIKMFQKKIKKQGRVTNARDEDHLENLIKIYKQMGGKKIKESVNERMDKRQAGEMLKQLGGNKFIAMTGAKNFAVGPKGASFKIGRNSKNVNYVRIDLKNDLYDMEFIQMRAGKLKVKSKVKQIYADQLQQMFTKHTGMYTSL